MSNIYDEINLKGMSFTEIVAANLVKPSLSSECVKIFNHVNSVPELSEPDARSRYMLHELVKFSFALEKSKNKGHVFVDRFIKHHFG